MNAFFNDKQSKQIRAETKNIMAFIGLFVGVIIVAIVYNRFFSRSVSEMDVFFARNGFIVESIFLFVGLLLLWKVNLKNGKMSIDILCCIDKLMMCCIALPIIQYIVNCIVYFALYYSESNGIPSLSIELQYICSVLFHFINFSVWLLLYVFICKVVFHLDGIYGKLKKSIIIAEVICFILALICAFSDVIVGFAWEQALGGNKSNFLFGVMKISEISSRFDTTNLIIFMKCTMMALIGIGVHEKFQN